jgi:hypothetical protein
VGNRVFVCFFKLIFGIALAVIVTPFSFSTGIDQEKGIIYGLITFVKKSAAKSVAQWKAWLYFLLLCIVSFVGASFFVGPLTAAAAMTLGIFYKSRISAFLLQQNFGIEKQIDNFSLFGVASGMFLLVSLVTFVFKSILSLSFSTNAWWMQAIHMSAIAFTMYHFHDELLKKYRLSHDIVFPSPSWPVEVYFHAADSSLDDEMEEFARLRKNLLTNPITKDLTNVPIGNNFLEAFCSVMVFYKIYNSESMRRTTVKFFTYLLPLLCFIQAILSLSPPVFNFLVVIFGAFRTDIGLSLLWKSSYILQVLRLDFLIPDGIFDSSRVFISSLIEWFSWLSLPLIEYEQWSTYIFARLTVFFTILRAIISPLVIAAHRLFPLLLIVLNQLRNISSSLPLLRHLNIEAISPKAPLAHSPAQLLGPAHDIIEQNSLASTPAQLQRPAADTPPSDGFHIHTRNSPSTGAFSDMVSPLVCSERRDTNTPATLTPLYDGAAKTLSAPSTPVPPSPLPPSSVSASPSPVPPSPALSALEDKSSTRASPVPSVVALSPRSVPVAAISPVTETPPGWRTPPAERISRPLNNEPLIDEASLNRSLGGDL